MSKRIRTKRYWYFVTQDFMGNKMDLYPRLPHSAGEDEPRVKRICVAPTAGHCMSAIVMHPSDPIYVYRTARRVTAEKAWDVGDSPITQEHFIRRKSKFEFVSAISPEWVRVYSNRGAFDDRGYKPGDNGYKEQKRQKEQLIRAVVKLDRRLGIIAESNELFRFEGERKLLGDVWPTQSPWNDMNTRDYVLEVTGLKPPQPPKQLDVKGMLERLNSHISASLETKLQNSV